MLLCRDFVGVMKHNEFGIFKGNVDVSYLIYHKTITLKCIWYSSEEEILPVYSNLSPGQEFQLSFLKVCPLTWTYQPFLVIIWTYNWIFWYLHALVYYQISITITLDVYRLHGVTAQSLLWALKMHDIVHHINSTMHENSMSYFSNLILKFLTQLFPLPLSYSIMHWPKVKLGT